MKVPVSWLKDFVDIRIPLEELAHRLTMAGLEVEEIRYVGLPMPTGKIEGRPGAHLRHETKITGLAWDPEKIVIGAVQEVMPHPNADRLVLCRLDDGSDEHIVLTGAPNLFPYKGLGPLSQPLKVAYAREGAQIFDGHQPGEVLTTLKRTKIRGVESYSMACSEKELGISDDHEGVIILDADAPVGVPLVDYMGDAVFDIALTPNLARDANIFGVAREIAALTGEELRQPDLDVLMEGPPIEGRVAIDIQVPSLNPRFVLGLIENIEIRPSPYRIQRRLRLAGMRPINNVVDATNYAMLELGEPLHAFDFDVLKARAGGEAPFIITRTAEPGERLTTLDGIDRRLDDFTVLVCDRAGPLSIAGVMGGAESEVTHNTRNILLEGAAWNFTNIRRTLRAQNLSSEAAYRFSRGVHPSLAKPGVLRGLKLMHEWAGGTVAAGLIDEYPMPQKDPVIEITTNDVERWLGINLARDEIAALLNKLGFKVEEIDSALRVTTPDHRLDIGEGITGVADLMEEIARIYGYDRIPETRLADRLPPQRSNPAQEIERLIQDSLVKLGLQEVITHRMTSPEQERKRFAQPESVSDRSLLLHERPYIQIANPISSDRVVLRQSLLTSLLEVLERNARLSERLAFFEIGKIYLRETENNDAWLEPRRLGIVMAGSCTLPSWQTPDHDTLDFYDMKGALESLMSSLHITGVSYIPCPHPTLHPGKSAQIIHADKTIGWFGEVHPLVKERFELPPYPVLLADLDVEVLQMLVPDRYNIQPVPVYPPVLEDLAFIVGEAVPAQSVADLIKAAGGETVTEIRLFDVYRGGQAGPGKKSLAFRITYRDPHRTLSDSEVAVIRERIVQHLEEKIGAVLRRQLES